MTEAQYLELEAKSLSSVRMENFGDLNLVSDTLGAVEGCVSITKGQ